MNLYIPLNYDQLNIINGTYNPSQIKPKNNSTFAYWQRALFQRACSVIDLGVDSVWKGEVKDFLYYVLFTNGFVSVFENDKYGLIFQNCTLNGFDLYYQPTNCIISNPAFESSLDLKIHDECELLKLTPDFMGIFDIINRYAEQLAGMDSDINMSIINAKVPFIMTAKNKAGAEAIKKIFDKVQKGEPLAIIDKAVAIDPDTKENSIDFMDRNSLKNAYILDQQLQDEQTILNAFDCEVGIPTLPYQKAERMVTDEATSKLVESQARCTIWVNTLNASYELINAKYGTNFKATLNYKKEGEALGETYNIGD